MAPIYLMMGNKLCKRKKKKKVLRTVLPLRSPTLADQLEMADRQPSSRSSRRYSQPVFDSTYTLPPPLSPFHSSGTGECGTFSSSRLPSPSEIMSGSGNFNYSLELPPLRNIPRSTTPLLTSSAMERIRLARPSSWKEAFTPFGDI